MAEKLVTKLKGRVMGINTPDMNSEVYMDYSGIPKTAPKTLRRNCGSGFVSGRGIGYFFEGGQNMNGLLSAGNYRVGDRIKVFLTGSTMTHVYAEVVGREGDLSLSYDVSHRDFLDFFAPHEEVDIALRFVGRTA